MNVELTKLQRESLEEVPDTFTEAYDIPVPLGVLHALKMKGYVEMKEKSVFLPMRNEFRKKQ